MKSSFRSFIGERALDVDSTSLFFLNATAHQQLVHHVKTTAQFKIEITANGAASRPPAVDDPAEIVSVTSSVDASAEVDISAEYC